MILNNFKYWLFNTVFCGNNSTAASALGVKNIAGDVSTAQGIYSGGVCYTSCYPGGNSCTASTSSSYVNPNSFSLTFGGGTTAVTADDYQMESPYTSGTEFDWVSCSINWEAVDGSLYRTQTGVITNISGEDLTVSELGWTLAYCSGSTSATTATALPSTIYNPMLLARSLITPVTISAGDTKAFTYTLDLGALV